MKLELTWNSDRGMRALFSNIGCKNPNEFYLLMVYHKSKGGGFSRNITVQECREILRKRNKEYRYIEV